LLTLRDAPHSLLLLFPGMLLQSLARSGINLVPKDHDAPSCFLDGQTTPIRPKARALERNLHADLCTLLPSFSITSSVWNQGAGPDRCACRIVEVRCGDS